MRKAKMAHPNKRVRLTNRTKLNEALRAFTRRKAEKLLASITTLAELEQAGERLSGHKNKHVTAKYKAKRARLPHLPETEPSGPYTGLEVTGNA